MMLFRYKVEFYNEIEEIEDTEVGIVVGENYVDAMTKLEENFRKTLTSVIMLKPIADMCGLILPGYTGSEALVDQEIVQKWEEFLAYVEKCQIW